MAFLVTAALLHHGYSAFDDGAYAWAMEELHAGRRLHADLPWGHPGYVLWILLPFERFLEADIVHYRYALPPLAAITAAACTLMARATTPARGLLSGLAVAALGYTQFSTYSASWFGVCLTAASLAAAHGSVRCPSPRLVVSAGLLAGLAFGFRGTNGVAAAAGALVVLVLADRAPAPSIARFLPERVARVVVIGALLLLALAVAAMANTAERALFALPVATCLLLAARHAWRHRPAVADAVVLLGAGFLLGLAPLLAMTVAQGSLADMLANILVIPGAIATSLSGYRINGIRDLVTQGMEIAASAVGPVTLGNAAFILFTVLAPLYLTIALTRATRPRPLLVLAAMSCIGMLSLPNIIYAPYLWPFAALALLDGTGARVARPAFVAALSIIAITLTPRGFIPGSFGWLTNPAGLVAAECRLERCSVIGDARAMAVFADDVELLARVVPVSRPLVVLPSGANFAYFLPHRMPFTLGRLDAVGDARAAAAFREDFLADPDIVLAVPDEFVDAYAGAAAGLCRYREEGRWIFMERCPQGPRNPSGTPFSGAGGFPVL